MVYLFLATGFEEVEALAPVDILRRADIEVQLISVSGEKVVTGSHGIAVTADGLFEETDFSDGELLVLPGGMPGTLNLEAHPDLAELLRFNFQNGKMLAAICAAPMVLGKLGLLNGHRATCYPSYEEFLLGAEFSEERVVVSQNIITSRGAGTAMEFGLALVEKLKGEDVAKKLAVAMLCNC